MFLECFRLYDVVPSLLSMPPSDIMTGETVGEKRTAEQMDAQPMKYLIYGRNGWIGSLMGDLLKKEGIPFEYGTARLEDRTAIMADIERVQPTRILNAAGVTGRPNVDWCEDNKQTCVRGNVIGTLNLADVCDKTGIHMIYYGTGCIFHYDEDFPENSGKGFKESDTPNFTGSYYSHCKAMTENLLQAFDNVLTLRVRMPIVEDVLYPRNFITKIIKYQKVIDIPNSMTVLPELLPPLARDVQAEAHRHHELHQPRCHQPQRDPAALQGVH